MWAAHEVLVAIGAAVSFASGIATLASTSAALRHRELKDFVRVPRVAIGALLLGGGILGGALIGTRTAAPSTHQAPVATSERPVAATISYGLSGKQPVSATENNAWQVALANRKDCEAIRTFIRQYPAGPFVAPAQAILAARRPVTEAKWVAFEFPANVVASSSLEARTSRDAACDSAHVQLLRNMKDGCSDFSRDSSKYRSVVVDAPPNTTCQCDDSAIHLGGSTAGADPVWRCSIRAIYRCRGEKLERATAYSCD